MGLPKPKYDIPDNTNYFAIPKPANDNNPLEEIANAVSSNKPNNVTYISDYQQRRIATTYNNQIESYLEKRINSLEDFTDRVPGKNVEILSASIMGGVLGFTYLGDNYMALRDDLIGDKEMVDIHESIHTPDEYETRILTDWIMSKERSKYIK